ncbi:MAG: hypothetical protein ACREX4_18710 [Gammaproteobacteria bacterium]
MTAFVGLVLFVAFVERMGLAAKPADILPVVFTTSNATLGAR